MIKCLWPVDGSRFFVGLELGKIAEVVTAPKAASSLVYSGSHTVYDIARDCRERLWFFDAGLSLRAICLGASHSDEVCQGEYWGRPA